MATLKVIAYLKECNFLYLLLVKECEKITEVGVMANLALTVERKAFSVAIDAALKSLNKDREKGLLQIVDLTEKFMGITSVKKLMMV